jgi:hypothetical protein
MTTCWSSIRGRRLRVTKVDNCGTPVAGTCSQVVSDGFVSVEFSPEIAEGEEVEVRKADGTICVSDSGCPELKWINVEIAFCVVDPDLFSLVTGWETVLDHAANAVGNRVSGKVSCDEGFALELWSDIPRQDCGATGFRQYGYFLLPWVVNGTIGDFSLENDAATFTLSARTKAGGAWGVGPHNVDAIDVANTPGPLLTPIGPDDHMDLHVTTIEPPAAVCGCQPLVIP